MYDSSLKYKWDNKNALDYALKEGMEKGIEKGREKGMYEKALAIAREPKNEGLALDFIAKTTELSIAEIEKL